MLKLLWVKAGRLLPLDSGGKLRSYHLARALAARHRLTMLTYYDGPRDTSYEASMEKEFPGAVTLRYGSRKLGLLSTGLRYVARLPLGAPFAVSKFTDRAVQRLVSEWMDEKRFDVMICDFLSASLNFREPGAMPTVLFQHNVESALWARQAAHAPGAMHRLVYGIEAAKMRRYETHTVRRFGHVVAVSDHDRNLMSAMVDASRITVVPTGVDASRFGENARREPTGPVVLFLGSMDWEANIDGVQWMCETMWARIRKEVPDAIFRIVGRSPRARTQRLVGEGIEVTGSVPSVDPYLVDAAAFVVPLRIGGGTRIKIFEAMSAGRAIVSTSIGAEGLPVTSGKDILLADDPDAFASAVIRVLKDAPLRRSLGAAAYELAMEHDWSRIVGVFEQALERAIPPRAAAPAAPRQA